MDMSNLNLELVNTQWFDSDAIRLPGYKVGRINYGYGRSYLRITDGQLESPFRLYTSLTTAINSCSPMERGLLEWYCKLGMAEADRYLQVSQHYGTLMHLLIGEYLQTMTFDFEEVGSRVQEYLSEHSFWEKECSEWELKLKYDVAAFIQFSIDYKIKPLGIEYVLLSAARNYGTLIDLVCKMTVWVNGFHGEVYATGPRKGEPKETKQEREITAIINFKSGRHAFWRSNGIQCICEKMLWEENFPDVPLDAAFNWSPKDWDTTPSYNVKDWTGEVDQTEIDAVLALADLRYGQKAIKKKYVSIGGQYYSTRGLNECVRITQAEEWARSRYSQMMVEEPKPAKVEKKVESEIELPF
jgi:hypothetical protein